MRNFIIIILAVLLFIVSAVFFAQNDSLVLINYFIGELNWQLNWVMVFCLILGFLLGIFSVSGSLLKNKLKLRTALKKLEQHQKEIDSLRALPLKDNY